MCNRQEMFGLQSTDLQIPSYFFALSGDLTEVFCNGA